MIQIIAGEKGTGKTKELITMANDAALLSVSPIIYLDKNNKHMYELSNQIRMINISDFHIENFQMFCGFLYGIAAQDYNLNEIYLDSFLTIAHISKEDLEQSVKAMSLFSDSQGINLVISVSMDADEMPDIVKELVTVSL